MRLTTFIKSFELHDASFDNLQYDPDLQICKLSLSRFVYLTEENKQSSTEVIQGQLLIKGVTYLRSQSEFKLLGTSQDVDGQILDASVISLEENNLEELKLILLVYDYVGKTRETLILWIRGQEVNWQPLTSIQE